MNRVARFLDDITIPIMGCLPDDPMVLAVVCAFLAFAFLVAAVVSL